MPNIVVLWKDARGDMRDKFEMFCLNCGIEVLEGMKDEEIAELAGERRKSAWDIPATVWM